MDQCASCPHGCETDSPNCEYNREHGDCPHTWQPLGDNAETRYRIRWYDLYMEYWHEEANYSWNKVVVRIKELKALPKQASSISVKYE